jgi:hydrogenase nickel incorporation protein HypB
MCKDCGCGTANMAHEHAHSQEHHHHDPHEHVQDVESPSAAGRTISVEQSLLAMNDHLAWHNRQLFQQCGTFVANLMSSPGAGKTRLLERTLDDLAAKLHMGVIVGDLQTDNDARRLSGRGAPVVPLTTGTMCHLEADLVGRACAELKLNSIDVLFVENVGNLVCPASFDLGEAARVVLMSVTEGEDKPLKYPPMFKMADVVLITKLDMAQAAEFDLDKALSYVNAVAPQARVIRLSAKTGEGLDEWYEYLLRRVPSEQALSEATVTA